MNKKKDGKLYTRSGSADRACIVNCCDRSDQSGIPDSGELLITASTVFY